jgi:hypothetical protein
MKKTIVKELGQISDQIIRSWGNKYEKTEADFICSKCRSRILQTICYVSIHLKEFEPLHAGPGRVVKINYPYCPKCDGELDHATACFHVSLSKSEVIDATPILNPGKGG